MIDILKKAQKLCATKNPTKETWVEFTDLVKQSNDEGEQEMIGDLTTVLMRNLIASGVEFDQELLN